MTIFIAVDAIVTQFNLDLRSYPYKAICYGCDASGTDACHRLNAARPADCGYRIIWIRDTAEACQEYIIKKLEN